MGEEQVRSGNRAIIKEFRAKGGRVGGVFEGASLVLLTTTGAKSGRPHTTPVVYLEDGRRTIVFASNAGASRHPAWLHNLVAHPQVTVEKGATSFAATAVVLEGEERDQLYARQSELAAAFAAYQEKTDRVIPAVALYPLERERGMAVGDHLVQVHEGLRRRLASLREGVAAYLAGGTAGLVVRPAGDDLREHCLTACAALHEHHVNEDGRGFPLLESNYPGLVPTLRRLRADHIKVAALTDEIQASVAALDPATVLADLDRLIAELDAHFAEEERLLVAALNAVRR